jgi:phosphatidate cytidylyltransferase
MRVRVTTSLVAFLVTLGALWAGTWALVPAYLLLSLVSVFEYAAMVRLRGIRVHRTGLLVMTVLMLPAAMPDGHPLALFARVGLPGREALLIGFLMGMLALALARSQRDALVTAVYTLLGYLWIPGFLSYGLTLRASPDPAAGLATLTLPVLAVIASDVGGWGFGTTLGRRKLAPVLSPDKTVEGAIGGLALAAAVLPVAARLLPGAGPATMPVGLLILFAVLVAAASQLGDLFESLVKRWAGVKDTGVFLPGQGGVLDRIDSALFALPVAYLLLSLLGYV